MIRSISKQLDSIHPNALKLLSILISFKNNIEILISGDNQSLLEQWQCLHLY